MKSEEEMLPVEVFANEVQKCYNILGECINLNPCDSAVVCAALGQLYFFSVCEVGISYEDFAYVVDEMKSRYKKHIEEGKCS
jgi:hypothetical protein